MQQAGTARRTRIPALDVPASWALPFLFIAAALATSYAMSGLPNVKLFDLMVFAAGYTLGFRRGAAVAVGAWLVYGHFNPWGVAQPQLVGVLMFAEVGYAAAGAMLRRGLSLDRVTLRPGIVTVVFAGAAVVGTLAFDLMTNVYTGYTWATIAGGGEYGRWISTALVNPGALFFMAVHIGSNVLFFAAFGPLLIRGAERAKERFGWR